MRVVCGCKCSAVVRWRYGREKRRAGRGKDLAALRCAALRSLLCSAQLSASHAAVFVRMTTNIALITTTIIVCNTMHSP